MVLPVLPGKFLEGLGLEAPDPAGQEKISFVSLFTALLQAIAGEEERSSGGEAEEKDTAQAGFLWGGELRGGELLSLLFSLLGGGNLSPKEGETLVPKEPSAALLAFPPGEGRSFPLATPEAQSLLVSPEAPGCGAQAEGLRGSEALAAGASLGVSAAQGGEPSEGKARALGASLGACAAQGAGLDESEAAIGAALKAFAAQSEERGSFFGASPPLGEEEALRLAPFQEERTEAAAASLLEASRGKEAEPVLPCGPQEGKISLTFSLREAPGSSLPLRERAPSWEKIAAEIVARTVVSVREGQSTFFLELKPEFLGKLWVTVTGKEEGLRVKIVAAEQSVRELLQLKAGELRELFGQQGINLVSLEVGARFAEGETPQVPFFPFAGEEKPRSPKRSPRPAGLFAGYRIDFLA